MPTSYNSEIIDLDRRSLLRSAALGIVVAGTASLFPLGHGHAEQNAEIRPFRVDTPEEDIIDLRRRINATRWSDKETVDDGSQGVQLAALQALVRHWGTAYDWRKAETRLNALPQFMTTIDGVDKAGIAYQFHARDLHLIMGPAVGETSVRFRVLIDGKPPGEAHGIDIDEQGNCTVTGQRLYQLVSQPKAVIDRQFEIEFFGPGVEVFAFTFG